MTYQGVYYIATGTKYVDEAESSLQTLRRFHDWPAAIATDVSDQETSMFDHHIPIEAPEFGLADKPRLMAASPFDQTLYLDTDIHVCGEIDELFGLLSQYDIAARPVGSYLSGEYIETPVPDCYPEYNTGVVLFQKNKKTDNLIKEWERQYQKLKKEQQASNDQRGFRVAAYNCKARLAPLPAIYNTRLPFRDKIYGDVHILHGRPDGGLVGDLPAGEIIEELNRDSEGRIYESVSFGKSMEVKNDVGRWWRRRRRIIMHLKKYGVTKTARYIINSIS